MSWTQPAALNTYAIWPQISQSCKQIVRSYRVGVGYVYINLLDGVEQIVWIIHVLS